MDNIDELDFIKTKDADISDNELRELLHYAMNKSGYYLDADKKDEFELGIIVEYHNICNYIKKDYVLGELDTFLRAACFAHACTSYGIFSFDPDGKSDYKNATIGAEAALAWIQKPYWYVGSEYNEPYEGMTVNLEQAFSRYPHFYESRRNNLIKSLIPDGEQGGPILISDTLYLLYQAAITTIEEEPNIISKEQEDSKKHTLLRNVFNRVCNLFPNEK